MNSASTSSRAALVEIFHSIQGEGRHVGEPMAFVRVATCPLRCRYCDTPGSYTAAAECRVRVGAEWRGHGNPVAAAQALALARESAATSAYGAGRSLSLSITGGEPLVYPGFVRGIGESLAKGERLHLETAAIHPDALAEVLPLLDHVSADWKRPETLEQGDPREEHLACLRLCAAAGSRPSLDLKIVLTPGIDEDGFEQDLERILPYRERMLLVLQPVTPFGEEDHAVEPERVAALARRAARRGFDYRVLPQVHKILGVE